MKRWQGKTTTRERDHVICHQHPLSIPISNPQIPSPNQPTNTVQLGWGSFRDADALANSLVLSRHRACLCAMHLYWVHPEMSKPNPTLSAPTGFDFI